MGRIFNRILEYDNMLSASEAVLDKKGIAGVDHITWKKWRRNQEERVLNLIDSVRCNTYKPRNLRTRFIPKSKPGEWRRLRIPTITDRVLQRAVLQVLYQIFEPIFHDCSYAYRPGRGLQDAVERIIVLRECDYQHVLDADIDDFFNSVDRAILLSQLEKYIDDYPVMNLLKLWLSNGAVGPGNKIGIAMGSPISPLFANLYLHPLDDYLIENGYAMVRYADDFIVLFEAENTARFVYEQVAEILESMKLKYEPSKTRLTTFEEGFDFIGLHFMGDSYSYSANQKRIEVHGNQVDFLFKDYHPDY